ncbi:MAG: nitrilase-related carbon-nitrogen hydrolase [Coriobacteriales bacterium]|nr:nitrilase-related carbon-nitrogen hydrolase [Coriobacteriales bacterium]
MRIGISQINTQAGDLAHTADRMAGISQVAAERGVDLLIFPVAALTGPTPVDYSNQGAFLSDVAEGLTDLATRVDCACLVPVVIPVGDGVSVEVAHLHDGIMTPIRYGKQVRSPFSTNTEDDGALATLEIAGSVLGLAFSYEDLDQWRDSSQSVDVICYLAGYGYAVDDVSSVLGAALDDGRYQQDALETGAWFVGVASLGGYGAQVFSGSSFVLAPDGQLVASSPAFEEDLLAADVGQGAAKEGARNITPEVYDDRYHLWQALVLGIHDYVHKLGRSDVALALDGTLSSMLLAVLATDALGPTHVHALLAAGGAARVADVSRLAQALRIDARPTTLAAADGLMARDLMQVELAALARGLTRLPSHRLTRRRWHWSLRLERRALPSWRRSAMCTALTCWMSRDSETRFRRSFLLLKSGLMIFLTWAYPSRLGGASGCLSASTACWQLTWKGSAT